MPRLPGSLFRRHRLSIGVPEVAQVLVQQGREQLVVGSVPTSAGQVETSDEGDQLGNVIKCFFLRC
jgi:hypothetical protein